MLEIKDVSKQYSDGTGIKHFSATLQEGHIYSIIGPNGAGKTTLCMLLSGNLTPDAGEIYLDNENVLSLSTKKNIGYALEDDHCYPNLKVGDLLFFIIQEKFGSLNVETFKHLLYSYNLSSYLTKKYNDCSNGVQKKIKLLLSLYGPTKLVILDEPTNGLDTAAIISLKRDINHFAAMGKIIVVSCHMLDFIEKVATEHFFLDSGSLALHVTDKTENLEDIYNRLYLLH